MYSGSEYFGQVLEQFFLFFGNLFTPYFVVFVLFTICFLVIFYFRFIYNSVKVMYYD